MVGNGDGGIAQPLDAAGKQPEIAEVFLLEKVVLVLLKFL